MCNPRTQLRMEGMRCKSELNLQAVPILPCKPTGSIAVMCTSPANQVDLPAHLPVTAGWRLSENWGMMDARLMTPEGVVPMIQCACRTLFSQCEKFLNFSLQFRSELGEASPNGQGDMVAEASNDIGVLATPVKAHQVLPPLALARVHRLLSPRGTMASSRARTCSSCW
jgi:hypothetical protein